MEEPEVGKPEAPEPEKASPAVAEASSEKATEAASEEVAEVAEVSDDEPAEEEDIVEDEGMVNLRANMTLKEMVKTISEITSEVYLLSDKIRDKKRDDHHPPGWFREGERI